MVASLAHLSASRCTFEGMALNVTGESTLSDCVVDGVPSAPGAVGADTAMLETLETLVPAAE